MISIDSNTKRLIELGNDITSNEVPHLRLCHHLRQCGYSDCNDVTMDNVTTQIITQPSQDVPTLLVTVDITNFDDDGTESNYVYFTYNESGELSAEF